MDNTSRQTLEITPSSPDINLLGWQIAQGILYQCEISSNLMNWAGLAPATLSDGAPVEQSTTNGVEDMQVNAGEPT